jgi:hypothetical protein
MKYSTEPAGAASKGSRLPRESLRIFDAGTQE